MINGPPRSNCTITAVLATARPVAAVVHRYVGLAMSVFLVLAGVTGSFVGYFHELDAVLNPVLLRASPPSKGAKLVDPLELRKRLLLTLPAGVAANYVPLNLEAGRSAAFFVQTQTPNTDDTYFVNPYTGMTIGSRRYADLSQGLKNLMPFLYRLHYSLALGTVGKYIMGAVGLLWTFDCFVGAYLTFPRRRHRVHPGKQKSWLARWRPSWLVRANRSFAFVFTWHRASGLWVWAMLLVFAWSSVGLNLKQAYNPVMKAAFGMDERAGERLPKLGKPRPTPKLSFEQAHARARQLMAAQAAADGFDIIREDTITYDATHGAYRYQVRSSRDISTRHVGTALFLDGDDGKLLTFEAPTGQNRGLTITTWLYHLHWGSITVGGWPYRLFISVMGITVTAISITGVLIWWNKSKRRQAMRLREHHPQSV